MADDHYVNTLSASYSTQNEVFVASGYITVAADMDAVNTAIFFIKILKHDTKKALNEADAGKYTVLPRDMTMYVKVDDFLNVRSGYFVSSPILGKLQNGTAVRVTGIVQKDGKDAGWYQVSYNNRSGYVDSDFLTETAPAANTNTAVNAAASNEVETYLVYSQGSGHPVNITGSGGVFYDGFGNVYYAVGGGNFSDSAGAYFSTTVPASAPETNVIGLVSDGSGRPVSIMENEDGVYTDDEGNKYEKQDDGSFVDEWDATYQVSASKEN